MGTQEEIKADIKFAEVKLAKLLNEFPAELDKLENSIFKKLKKSKRNNLKKLDDLYEAMNKFSKFIDQYTPCKNQCSKCCYIRVDISEIEIQHIEKNYKIKRNKNIRPNTDGSGSPCCFLKEDTCSIYEGRPFMCRRHFFFTPDDKWCGDDFETNQEFPLIHMSEIDKSYLLIKGDLEFRNGILEINEYSNNNYDIREVFGKE